MTVVGVVGYIETPRGLRALTTLWAKKLDRDTLRRFYKNWMNSKKKAFTKHSNNKKSDKDTEIKVNRIKKYCSVVRLIVTTNMNKLNFRQKKNHIMEI